MHPKNTIYQPVLRAPNIIRLLAALAILVHFRGIFLTGVQENFVLRYFAFIPERFQSPELWHYESITLALSPVTYAYIHSDMYHLLLNVFFLLAFGTAVARRMSLIQFLLLYIFSGIFSAFFWMGFNPHEIAPLIGSSGALSGILGALVHISIAPKFQTDPCHPIMPKRVAVLFSIFWVGTNLIFWLFEVMIFSELGNIAWEAHIGGFIFGFLVGRTFDGRGLPNAPMPPGH